MSLKFKRIPIQESPEQLFSHQKQNNTLKSKVKHIYIFQETTHHFIRKERLMIPFKFLSFVYKLDKKKLRN